MTPCFRCSRLKIKCNRERKCNHCGDRHGCTFSANEIPTRAKLVLGNICDGLYYHNDIIKYQLYLQGCHLNTRKMIKSTEARDIYKRITQKFGEERGSFKVFTLDVLPQKFRQLIAGTPIYKVEWMFGGSYKIHASDNYQADILDSATIIDTAREHKIPYKLIDFSNTRSLDVYYKLWIESVFTPMNIVEIPIDVFFRKRFEVEKCTLKMITFINSFDSMITLTLIYKKQCYLFP